MPKSSANLPAHDVVVVGAGFSGMYMAHLLAQAGFDVQGFERGSDVGGTWYWNRYPGCRCDVESMEYSYQFSPELEQDWHWPERYSAQPDILAYAQRVATDHKLRPLFRFDTAVTEMRYGEGYWTITTAPESASTTARYVVMATGCLSAANIPQFDGLHTYSGKIIHTGAWPQEGVELEGKRVGIIGTGSSGIQSIPLIAREAEHLTVFQRTANYSVPAQNRPMDPAHEQKVKANYRDFRERNYQQQAAFGCDYPRRTDSILDATPEAREQRLEEYWQLGGFMFLGAFGDIGLDMEANALAAEFVRNKIRAIVKDPETADLLCPDSVLGCKRLCADTGYFETYNRDNVQLVDVSKHPISKITKNGPVTNDTEYPVDVLIFATGFDAMTGALLRCNITGANDLKLADKWSAGPRTYLGLAMAGFPNLFTMTGPGSPSVLANMITGAEQHAEFLAGLLGWARENHIERIEAETAAEDAWVETVNMRASATLYPRCNSWYLGANIPGKPRVFMPYIGFPDYTATLQSVSNDGYAGFRSN